MTTTADTQRYIDHLSNLIFFRSRFDDVFTMEICDWMIGPFAANVDKAGVRCKEELLLIRYDGESKSNSRSDGYIKPRQCQMPNLYPSL